MAQADIDIQEVKRWLDAGATAIRVEITAIVGSAPRGPGAAMVVTANAHTGTIGGGALEWTLIAAAREMVTSGETWRDIEQPLGPDIGQCCGGMVSVRLTRLAWADLSTLAAPDAAAAVYIFGAGHVGAALARALSSLPLSLTIIDQRGALLAPLAEFGDVIETALPEAHVDTAPEGAAFVITTHDHALDFLIVEAALARGDATYVGMIGSASKRAVLARRLAAAGLSDTSLTCPIGGRISKDKRPEIIATMTAAEIVAAIM